jgi:DNA-directed RNA polymerase specialized sigma24 family protein
LLADVRWLQALAQRLVTDPEVADDLLQEAWFVALERPPRQVETARTFASR